LFLAEVTLACVLLLFPFSLGAWISCLGGVDVHGIWSFKFPVLSLVSSSARKKFLLEVKRFLEEWCVLGVAFDKLLDFEMY
jgi:hypothetical protein